MGKSQQLLLLVGAAREGAKEERPERFGEDFKHGYQLHPITSIPANKTKPIYISSQPIHLPILSLGNSDRWFIIGLQEMKITAELIQHSPQFTNPLNERQLDLRGYKITAIQNMGATLNFFECIDLSDNELRRLGNFTNLDRLTSIVATNNRIKAISPDLAESLPNLENIFLMNNKIGELEEIGKLAACKKLQRLVLANNLVAELPNYRLFTIAKIPSLRILDFAKISSKQRRQAQAMFGVDQPSKK